MTLVGLKDEDLNRLPIMLSVHQQQHHGLLTGPAGPQSHRGNVIVSTSSVPGSIGVGVGASNHEIKMHGCKRSKIYTQSSPYGTLPHQPASVARRNARERNRVKQVNNGFATLRQHIPQSVAQALGASVSTSPTPAAAAAASNTAAGRAASKKLSKVETLRMAVEYIRSLQRLLDEHDGTSSDTGTMTSSSSASSPSSSCSSSSSSSSSSTSTSPASSNTDSQLDLITDGGNHHHRHHLHHHHHHHHHSHHNDHHQQQQQPQQQMRLIGSSNGDIQAQTNELHVQLQRAANVGSPSSFVAAPCSEASSSPTPSFVSDASSAGSQGYGGGSGPTSGTTTSIYASHSDSYDNYEPMSPEDEELLDVISWWQQSQ